MSTTTSAVQSAISLKPNDHGYVRVEIQSNATACSITTELVACQTTSGNWHDANGQRQHTVSVNADGGFHWVDADLGELQGRVRLDFRTYTAQGWTIVAELADTKFVNDRTGHGMTVTDQGAVPF
jgi:hypothetical protein